LFDSVSLGLNSGLFSFLQEEKMLVDEEVFVGTVLGAFTKR